MKTLSIMGIFLSILGFFGALRFSSIFFGFFTMGLLLIIYSSTIKNEMPPTILKSSTLTKSTKQPIEQTTSFCPKCGAKFDVIENFCPFCGDQEEK